MADWAEADDSSFLAQPAIARQTPKAIKGNRKSTLPNA
jgi:hypothetical protein